MLPQEPLSGDELAARIGALNTLLHHDHAYHYCGIFYVDHMESPGLIKIYDPIRFHRMEKNKILLEY